MASRSLLRGQLARAWHKTINQEYSKQLINSERGLQVYFCQHLLEQFSKSRLRDRRRLFIEPRLTALTATDSAKPRYPDIVICNSRRIIGIVEIKYLPRAQPTFEKDLRTLNWVIRHAKNLKLSNDRYLGEKQLSREYPLADDAVLCWAGVHMETHAKIALPTNARINSRLFALHAITAANTPATPLPSERDIALW